MSYLLEEYQSRRSLIFKTVQSQDSSRLSNFLEWLESHEITAAILSEIGNNSEINEPSSDRATVLWGLQLMRDIALGKSIRRVLRLSFDTGRLLVYDDSMEDDEMTDWIMRTYIGPALDHIEMKLIDSVKNSNGSKVIKGSVTHQINIAGNISESTVIIGNHNDVQNSTKIDSQFSARKEPILTLKLIDGSGQYKDELTFVQSNNNQDFLFGIALTNIAEGSIPAEKLDIHIEISWDGTDISKAPTFRATDAYGGAIPGWTATRSLIQQSDIPLPAKLTFRGTNDIRCPFGYPLEWHRFSVVLAEKVTGRFILNYSVSSASPIIESKGKCYITMSQI